MTPSLSRFPASTFPRDTALLQRHLSERGWAFEDLTSGDSCAELEKKFGPAGTIQRAGYWSTTGFNNAMVRCDGGALFYYRGTSDSPLSSAFDAVKSRNLKNCKFTVAPVALPLFGWPYDPTKIVSGLGVFTYDHYLQNGVPQNLVSRRTPGKSPTVRIPPKTGVMVARSIAREKKPAAANRARLPSRRHPPTSCRTEAGSASSTRPETATNRPTIGFFPREPS